MADISVKRGQGISQAIASKLGLNKEQLKGIKLETWQSVMTEISNIQDKRNKTPEDDNIFTGGNDVSTINKKENWKSNFIVQEGTFSIDDKSWEKIEQMLTGKTPEPKKETPVEENKTPVKAEPPVEEPPKETPAPKAEPQVEEQPKETPAPKTEPELQDIPDGAKIKRRDIANVGEEGLKETVARVKENDVKKYYQVETDPETHEEKLGQRLIADTRGIFRKNQYYSVDASIPDGARADLKTVDGQKDSVTVSFKGADNKTHIYATTLSDDGTLTLKDELVKIAGSKKYYTQSKVNSHLQETFGTSALPENVTVQLIESKGDVEYIYKKDGKRVDESDVKSMLNPETKPEGSTVPTSSAKPEGSTTPTVPSSNPKPTKMTPQEVEGFVNADSRVTTVIAQLPSLQQTAKDLQQHHDEAWASKDFEEMDKYSNVEVFEAKSKFEKAQRAVEQYKNTISNWQDGTKINLQTGTLAGEFERVTLDNGTKGYKGERYENGKKVIYYMNIDFNTEFGMAGSIGNIYKKITE